MADQKPHLSMIRGYTLADVFTLANAASGTGAIFLCLGFVADGHTWALGLAFLLLPFALACDILDGLVARRARRPPSALGADLDSLADVISFGVAPAVLGFTLGLRGGWDVLCLIYFVTCGISRLARFNVTAAALTNAATGKVRYFEGTPIPTSIVIVALLALACYLGHTGDHLWFGTTPLGPAVFHPMALLYVASGSAMISATLRIPKP